MDDRGASSHVRILAGGLDTGAGSPFVQDRLTLLGKTVFLLSFGFFVVINGMLIVGGGLRILPFLITRANVWHLLSSSAMAALWAITRARPWSLRTLGILDAGSVLLPGVGLALMAAQPDEKQLMAGMFALTVTMMARAVLIPSTANRTLCLSSIASAPLLTVSFVFHRPAAMPGFAPEFLKALISVNALLWLTIAVTLSTVTSRTIYGLRKQVKEASDIGPYTLEAKIGSGGMGEVWRARHRMLIRPAAVKLITNQELGSSAGHDSQLRLRRFEREARATAGLRSPHTVQLYDFGVTDNGTLYYVMELLDGMDLDTLDALILECLEKDPDKRPANASVLQSRLQAISLETPWTNARAENWWTSRAEHVIHATRRRRSAVSGGAPDSRNPAGAPMTTLSGAHLSGGQP